MPASAHSYHADHLAIARQRDGAGEDDDPTAGIMSALRIRPAELELAPEEAGQPLGFLFCGVPYPSRLLGEGFDLDDEPVSLALVAPEAFHTAINQ